MVSPLLVVALVHAGVATAFTIVCLVASVVRATPTSRRGASRVFLLRPMEIASPAIVARLLFDARAYSGELVRVWCAPVAIAVPEGVRVAVSGLADDAAQNRKSAHLAAGLALVAAELDERSVVVHADSDVRLLATWTRSSLRWTRGSLCRSRRHLQADASRKRSSRCPRKPSR